MLDENVMTVNVLLLFMEARISFCCKMILMSHKAVNSHVRR